MTEFKVMTWNVENLFHVGLNDGDDEQAFYSAKITLLSDVIAKHDPDVVALQEVGGPDPDDGIAPLDDLCAALGNRYVGCASAHPDGRGIRVGFLSKFAPDPGATVDFVDFMPGAAFRLGDGDLVSRMGRGGLNIRVKKDGISIDLLSVHLKSKLLSYPSAPGRSRFAPRDEHERAEVATLALMRRGAEAATVRMVANSLIEGNADVKLVVLGDLNDVPDAQTSLILNGPPGSEIETAGFHRPDKGDDARLFNLAPCIVESRRYSRMHRGRAELLDQILVSEGMLQVGLDGRRRLPIVDSDVHFFDELPSVTEDPGDRAFEVQPDHAPVVATFVFN